MSSERVSLENGRFWLLTVAAGAALILVVINILLARSNQVVQAEINDRQQFINQTIRVSRLNTQVIQALANLSARTGDEQIRKLLADHGISFSENAGRQQEESDPGDDQNPDGTD